MWLMNANLTEKLSRQILNEGPPNRTRLKLQYPSNSNGGSVEPFSRVVIADDDEYEIMEERLIPRAVKYERK